MFLASHRGPHSSKQLPIVDWRVFEEIRTILAPTPIDFYLRTLFEHGNALLDRVRRVDLFQPEDDIADSVHAFSGSADMFGFKQVAALGRRLEYGLRDQAAPTHVANDFTTAIIATLDIISSALAHRPGGRILPLFSNP